MDITLPLPRDPVARAAVGALLDAWWRDATLERKLAAYLDLRERNVHAGQLVLTLDA